MWLFPFLLFKPGGVFQFQIPSWAFLCLLVIQVTGGQRDPATRALQRPCFIPTPFLAMGGRALEAVSLGKVGGEAASEPEVDQAAGRSTTG